MRTWRDGEGVGGLGVTMLCFRDQGKDAKEVFALGRTFELSPSFMTLKQIRVGWARVYRRFYCHDLWKFEY